MRLGLPASAALAASLLALAGAVAVALAIGSVAVAPAEVVGALVRGATGRAEGALDAIVWQVRAPRVLGAALVGAGLALAGTAFQAVFRNPLADPYLLGAASGAGFGAAVAIVYGAALPVAFGVTGTAFVCALATVALVVALARRGGHLPVVSLILAGVVLGSSLSAATSFVMLAAHERTAGVLSWLLGSFAFVGPDDLVRLALVVGAALVVGVAARRGFDLLQAGETTARSLGLPVERFKWAVVGAATAVTATAVAAVGVIGFVGLIVPHAVRLAFGPEHARAVPLAAVWGAAFLVLADLTARTVLAPAEIPVGVVTALVGGPFFLLLLRRGARS